MLKNECYVGDLRLQKTFVADHLQKKQLPNRGELPQYLVHDATNRLSTGRPLMQYSV